MKKKISFICSFCIFFLSVNFLSCVSQKSLENTAHNTEIDKKVTAARNIALQIMEGNLEAAYYRMNGDFRAALPYGTFLLNWELASKDLGALETFSVDTSEYSTLSFYKVIRIDFKFADGVLPARYLFKENDLLPSEVTFGGKPIPATENIPPLKDLCSNYFKFGCGISGYNEKSSALNVERFMEIVEQQFSSVTSTNLMKPVYVLNQKLSQKNLKESAGEPGLNFSSIDRTLTWCMNHKVPLRGHTLVWHSQTPDWFFKEGYESNGEYVSRDVMIQRLDSFIGQYLTYVQTTYPGTVYCWDVVNEAVDPDKGDPTTDFMCRIENSTQPSGWYQTIGKDYPEVAFSIARKYADNDVKLFYNDYGTIGKRKRQYIYNLCKSLKEKNLIDGIGMQGYWDVKNPSLNDIEEAINQYSELGLELQLTEWTIPVASETEEGFIRQAERYASVLKLLQKLDTQGGGNADITCVSFFGLQDGFSLNINDTNTSRLYDKNFNPKPAFLSIQDAFMLYNYN